MIKRVLRGIVQGNTIHLNDDAGIADGEEVEIVVRLHATAGEGFQRTEGALADDAEWDDIMDEVHQARKLERRPPQDEI